MADTTPQIQVTGARELRAALKAMGADLADLKAIHREAAESVADSARSRVPIVSGTLLGTIRTSVRQTGASVMAGGGRRRVPYAGPIHFGWHRRHIVPQPFLYDAMDDRRDEVAAKYQDRIEALVIELDARTPDR